MTKIKRYVILTPFARAEVLAGIAALQKLDVYVVLSKSGALLVRDMEVPQYDEWDIRNITGPDEMDAESGDPSDNAPGIAAFLSRLTPYGVVLIDVDLGDEGGFEAGVSGLVRARRFVGGEPGEEIPGGQLLNALDPAVERVVLGEKTPAELGAIRSSDLSPEDVELLVRAANETENTVPGKPKRGFFGRRRKDSQ